MRTLLRLQRETHTGTLRVRSEACETQLLFHRGRAVAAHGGAVEDSLGRLLLEQGVIDEATYAQSIDALVEDDATDMQLGMVLMQAGHLTGEDLSSAFATQVKRKVGRPLSYRALTMAFNPSDDVPKGTQKYPCRIEPCILSATRHHFGVRGATHYLGGLADKYLSLRANAAEVAQRFEMSTHEARFLANLTGGIQTRRLLRGGEAGTLEPAVVVAALVLAAELNASPTPIGDAVDSAPRSYRRPPGVRGSNSGLRRSSPGALDSQPGQSDAAPVSEPPVSGRTSPVSSIPPNERISIPEARISQLGLEAEIPGPPSQRSPASMRPGGVPPVRADQAFQRGLRHMRAEQWGNAADEFGQAAAQRPDSTEYKLYAAWASYQVCTLEDERSVLRLELEDTARKLAKESRNNAFAPYVLGHVALAAEQEDKALKLFRMATKLDRKNRDAERHVRLLSSRLEGGKGKGKLGGLF